jgi:hypothetical protein
MRGYPMIRTPRIVASVLLVVLLAFLPSASATVFAPEGGGCVENVCYCIYYEPGPVSSPYANVLTYALAEAHIPWTGGVEHVYVYTANSGSCMGNHPLGPDVATLP